MMWPVKHSHWWHLHLTSDMHASHQDASTNQNKLSDSTSMSHRGAFWPIFPPLVNFNDEKHPLQKDTSSHLVRSLTYFNDFFFFENASWDALGLF